MGFDAGVPVGVDVWVGYACCADEVAGGGGGLGGPRHGDLGVEGGEDGGAGGAEEGVGGGVPGGGHGGGGGFSVSLVFVWGSKIEGAIERM